MSHDTGVDLGGGGGPFIRANRIHGSAVGISGYVGSGGRLLGNAIYDNWIGAQVGPGFLGTFAGNFFSRNTCGVRLASPSQANTVSCFGPDNVFASNEAWGVVASEKGALVECAIVPSDTCRCANCPRVIVAGKNSCGGCAKFGVAYSPCYCGAACQKAHWPAHRAECRRAEERQRAREAAFAAAADALLLPRIGPSVGAAGGRCAQGGVVRSSLIPMRPHIMPMGCRPPCDSRWQVCCFWRTLPPHATYTRGWKIHHLQFTQLPLSGRRLTAKCAAPSFDSAANLAPSSPNRIFTLPPIPPMCALRSAALYPSRLPRPLPPQFLLIPLFKPRIFPSPLRSALPPSPGSAAPTAQLNPRQCCQAGGVTASGGPCLHAGRPEYGGRCADHGPL